MAETTREPLARSFEPAELHRGLSALEGFRRLLQAYASTLDATWQPTIDGRDPEDLHQLRITLRRTRSLLGEAQGVVPKPVRRSLATELAWLGQVIGPARDLDVHLQAWASLTMDLTPRELTVVEPVVMRLTSQRAEAHVVVAEALTSVRANRLRHDWWDWLEDSEEAAAGGKHANGRVEVVVARRLRSAQARVLVHGRGIDPTSPATHLHRLRKDTKRLRYLLEAFGSLGGRRRSRDVLRHLKDLQDLLGAVQDTQVQAEWLRGVLDEPWGFGPHEGLALEVVEQLVRVLDVRQATARAGFEPAFAAYDRRPVRRAFEELLGRMSG